MLCYKIIIYLMNIKVKASFHLAQINESLVQKFYFQFEYFIE